MVGSTSGHIGDIVHTGKAKGISHYLYLSEPGAQPQSPQLEDLWLGPIFLKRDKKTKFNYFSFKIPLRSLKVKSP